ncbi:MAG: TolC family protein, partial [Pseudomonadales bacterium]|nr:TolC family protein [Pseudomonadales bacterium]
MFQLFKLARWHVLYLIGSFLLISPVFAESMVETINSGATCEPPTPVTSEALVQLAVKCSAQQQAISARWLAQQKRIDAAGSLSDPKLMLGVAPNTLGDDRLDDGYIIEIRQPLPWPGILSLRKQSASAKADVWEARVSQGQVVLARDVSRLKRLVNLPVQASLDASPLGSASSKIEGSVAELPDFLPDFLPDNLIEMLLTRLDQQPLIRKLRAQQQKKASELALAEKERKPSFSIMTRYNSLWMNEEQRWVVGVGINLPFATGSTSREGSLRAEQRALRWEQQDRALQLREQLVQSNSYWRQANDVNQLYQNELLPLAEENLITARDEYQSGAGDFLSLLTAQRQALTTQ